MKKFFLGIIILLDLILIGAAGYVLVTYVRGKLPVRAAHSASTVVAVPTPASTSPVKAIGNELAVNPPAGESSVRKILFKYRNPKARQVSIRADFTGWKGEPMQKDANGMWTYQAPLTPGEYAYCFTVDDKTFKEPANKRTKVIGRTTVSAIVVEALPSKAVK